MATAKQIEAAAREMFGLSFGASLGVYHWPGDNPRPVTFRPWKRNAVTISADDPCAPDGGNGPDKLRKMAKQILTAAEAAN